jgi:hypothetical protein
MVEKGASARHLFHKYHEFDPLRLGDYRVLVLVGTAEARGSSTWGRVDAVKHYARCTDPHCEASAVESAAERLKLSIGPVETMPVSSTHRRCFSGECWHAQRIISDATRGVLCSAEEASLMLKMRLLLVLRHDYRRTVSSYGWWIGQ